MKQVGRREDAASGPSGDLLEFSISSLGNLCRASDPQVGDQGIPEIDYSWSPRPRPPSARRAWDCVCNVDLGTRVGSDLRAGTQMLLALRFLQPRVRGQLPGHQSSFLSCSNPRQAACDTAAGQGRSRSSGVTRPCRGRGALCQPGAAQVAVPCCWTGSGGARPGGSLGLSPVLHQSGIWKVRFPPLSLSPSPVGKCLC